MALVGLVWAVQPVPPRIYKEARAIRANRRARSVVSVVEPGPIGLELAEDAE
jgi:NADPH-dependent 2,4-dienoyl-CoA reductase/sulfur reductase-like enzyme